MNMVYAAPQGSLFGVPIVAEKSACCLRSAASTRCMATRSKAIDAGASAPPSHRRAAMEEMAYDYIHVIPPQRAPGLCRAVGLAWADRWVDQGWVEVDPETLRHLRYPDVFAVGDVAGVPKGKTAASVKWQVPVVEDHLVAAIDGREGTEVYNGYTSCPLITRSAGRC
jgi:sulfide:quinone oxidoreductase